MKQQLMIQGTTSDAGKSTLVAGLCRILQRRSIKVAPFKPQNMALNSAVTSDGGEIGRAQALQALAASIPPTVHMNPILLKPSTDTNAQIIVQGKALSHIEAKQYQDFKKKALPYVLDSYSKLKEEYEVIITEGAGSPAEINLRENDIANMGFAEVVDCPVVIVADIDRGGVFAHLVGTLELLSESERNRVSGFIINRFRGDISLLRSGLTWLEQKTNKPVLGVVPYIKNLYLDQEDAIEVEQQLEKNYETLQVVVPVLSRISNHTDFDALRYNPSVTLTFCDLDNFPRHADLIVLPGTKNVRNDLQLLKNSGWESLLRRHLRYGGKLMGICGGYQMLGKRISDPEGVESDPGDSCGFGFLDCETRLESEKKLSNTNAQLLIVSGENEFHGYEIHCGVTHSNEKPFAKLLKNKKLDGAVSADGQIIGTYLHGVFDDKESADALLEWAGLRSSTSVSMGSLREKEIDRLADTLEAHLDLKEMFPRYFVD